MYQSKERKLEQNAASKTIVKKNSANPVQLASALGNQSMLQLIEATQQKRTANNTGIPTQMKQSFEERSGFSFDDVRVHYNSDKPAQLQALAYTQGNQVYVGPGQEKHLGHELGHVVQQKQGRVRATTNVNGMEVNDDVALENEADVISFHHNIDTPKKIHTTNNTAQPFIQKKISSKNIIQFERVPTFYTYMHSKFQHNGTLPLTNQGPHTISHHFIEEYINKHCWSDIYKEQILIYPFSEIENILSQEGISATNMPNFLNYKTRYETLFKFLETSATQPSGIGSSILEQLDTQGTSHPQYTNVRNAILEIMEMHPYGSYAWNRPYGQTLPFEMQGKGESSIDIFSYRTNPSMISKIVDPLAQFSDMTAYEKFLKLRLDISQTSSLPINREQAISQIVDNIISEIRLMVSSFTNNVDKSVLYHLQSSPITNCELIFMKLKQTQLSHMVSYITIIQKYYNYPALHAITTLKHLTGTLPDCPLNARQKEILNNILLQLK